MCTPFHGAGGLDRYAYVNNSPLNFVDPSGHVAETSDNCDADGYCGYNSDHSLESIVSDNSQDDDEPLTDYDVTDCIENNNCTILNRFNLTYDQLIKLETSLINLQSNLSKSSTALLIASLLSGLGGAAPTPAQIPLLVLAGLLGIGSGVTANEASQLSYMITYIGEMKQAANLAPDKSITAVMFTSSNTCGNKEAILSFYGAERSYNLNCIVTGYLANNFLEISPPPFAPFPLGHS